ncbi:exopolyphosphatase / guanosine-5'-triphosphate,3'-diphosphate pyrophosphatase [Thermodesulfobium acidiphilum]|uniref:Exopolyphosphatase / guanosine-5'-triphosphate,3'-diphosphate pyrophosphatase n=1 Tax=Thermodesulfobium acidiphilum TaxID=1794699 RepID=A0A2R4VYT2_THEAF|nr:Ppx/GppA phosphatase family protein [Thermodesulfobium acidiphilum]AWB09699.1 exopolyphosphatase / guanosine-5'-triphosphate,3'-diphosphate pyrophosphatase [Thermodesulfobium acidiphilum]
MGEKLSVIDLGSNSIRLGIIEVNENRSFRIIEEKKEQVRLSEGFNKNNIIQEKPIKRAIQTLKTFKKIIEFYKVKRIIAVATACIRNSKNGKEVLDLIFKETLIPFKTISEREESYYGYLGVLNTVDLKNFILIDTGGASTEITYVLDRKIENFVSLPYGSVNLTDIFPETKEICDTKKIENFLKKEFQNIPWLTNLKTSKLPIVGIGGSNRTFAKVHRALHKWFSLKLHHYELTKNEVFQIYAYISGLSSKSRKNIEGLSKQRSDIILAGMTPLKVLFEITDSNKFIVSGNGLKEGIIFSSLHNDFKAFPLIYDDILKASLENIANLYFLDVNHAKKVTEHSLSIFDQLRVLHNFEDKDRKILEIASFLHDIGKYVDPYNHAKHGAYLIQNLPIYGVTPKDLVRCSYICLFHENKVKFQQLPNESFITNKQFKDLIKLSMFLRLAEQLETCECFAIDSVKIKIKNSDVTFKIISNDQNYNLETEIIELLKSAKLFKKLFGKELKIAI